MLELELHVTNYVTVHALMKKNFRIKLHKKTRHYDNLVTGILFSLGVHCIKIIFTNTKNNGHSAN
jgi:hypothetical protein